MTSRIFLAAAVATLSVAGCKSSKTDGALTRNETQAPAAATTQPPPPAPAPAPTSGAVANVSPLKSVQKKEGKAAANFTWIGSDGKEHSLEEYKGKVVLVNFWGTWCPPCRRELPDLVKLRTELGPKGFEIIGVNVNEQAPGGGSVVEHVNSFAQKNGLAYPLVIADDEQTLEQAYGGIRGVPTTFVVNRNGEIVNTMVGGRDEATFRKAIEAAW
ncbi:MAG: TlpA family protein disulfide reductase [Chlorobi bacterium CHB2]|nr:TlpA family protein disulfide reductase [Chlorobi bacterium CHB2]